MQSRMKATITLSDADGGTIVTGVHEHVSAGIPPDDNEMGWRIAFDRLARLCEDVPSNMALSAL